MSTHTDLDLDGIVDAIAPSGPSRRTVAKGMAWSLPVIAGGIAAPPAAASEMPPPCDACNPVNNCFITVGPGACSCAPGLVCVGTGPLGLANVCVGTDLLLTDCGGSTCYGVCLAAGGAIIAAVNTFMTAMSTFVTAAVAILGRDAAQPCAHQPGLPSNVCISPFGDGRLGGLCTTLQTCGSTAQISLPLAVLNTAYTTMISTLHNLGVNVASQCQAPYVCKDGASMTMDYHLPLVGTHVFGLKYQIGFCGCADGSTVCPGATRYDC